MAGTWTGALMRWYRRNRKPLAWRDDPQPYHVWVGEVMSQQTNLAVAADRFERFVAEIPDVFALARCPEGKLRRLWSGLGYYARARNLKRGARFIVETNGGDLPTDRDGWLAVPGCGPYTSAVVASMCHGQKVHCIDGNVMRVWSRLEASSDDPRSSIVAAEMNRDLGRRIRRVKRPGDFNQAIMELGQEICTKKSPGCAGCPVRRHCLALERDIVAICPPPRTRKPTVDVALTVVIVTQRSTGRVMIARRTKGFLSRTVGFPLVEGPNVVIRGARDTTTVGSFDHVITHHRIHASVMVLQHSGAPNDFAALASGLGVEDPRFIDPIRIPGELSSALDRKAFDSLAPLPPKNEL